MKKYKIVYIGAGSFRFTIPCTLNILDFAKTYHPVELWLVDIDVRSLALMTMAVRQIIRYRKMDIKVYATTDRRKALPNADYVLISISIGIQRTEWFDIHIPLKFGIPQNTGDSVGPGGIFRGLRTIPVIVDILNDVNDLCPNATVKNFTNPMSTTMLGIKQTAPNVRSVGFCHEIYLGWKKFIKFINYCGIDTSVRKNVNLVYGGINHFAFITKFDYGGEDLIPMIQKRSIEAYESGKFHRTLPYYLANKYGYYSYVEDRHVAEFLPRYYNYFNYNQQPFSIKLRSVKKFHIWRTLTYGIIKWALKRRNHWFIKLLMRPMEGGERALLMLKNELQNIPNPHVCNTLNNGIIPSLPDNCIVEVPCFFKDGKLVATKVGHLPKSINNWVTIHAKNQQLVVDASLSGNPDDILEVLYADPMCQFIEDNEKIEAMMWNMLYYLKRWLPNFSESSPSYTSLKKLKYHIGKHELSSLVLAKMVKFTPDPKLKSKAWPQVQ